MAVYLLVYSDIAKCIDEACIASDKYNWQRKHWGTITQFYAKAPYFTKYKEYFEEVYLAKKWTRLSELNQHLIVMISGLLGIKTKFMILHLDEKTPHFQYFFTNFRWITFKS